MVEGRETLIDICKQRPARGQPIADIYGKLHISVTPWAKRWLYIETNQRLVFCDWKRRDKGGRSCEGIQGNESQNGSE